MNTYSDELSEIVELIEQLVQTYSFSRTDYNEIVHALHGLLQLFDVSIDIPQYLLRTVKGDTLTVETPLRQIEARYAVMELDDLIASHDEQGFSVNKLYPQNCQQRAYHYDALEQYKVQTGANKLNPRFLLTDTPTATDGSPMVSPDGIVLGGNGRTMMLKLAKLTNNEGYQQYSQLVRQSKTLAKFGIDEDISEYSHPVLVRVLDDVDMNDCALYSNILNTDYKQSIDIQTKTISYARQFDNELINQLANLFSESENAETLKHFLSDTEKAIRLRKMLEKAGIITNQNKADFIDITTTIFSEQGKIALEGVLLSIVLTEKKYIEAARSFTMIILASLPQLLAIQGLSDKYNITQNIKEAIMLEYSRRASNLTKKALLKRMKSGDLYGDIKPPSELTEIVWDILGLGQKKFRKIMAFYVKEAIEQITGSNMFAKEKDSITMLKELYTMTAKKNLKGLNDKYDDEFLEILNLYTQAVEQGLFTEDDVAEINGVLSVVLPLFDVEYEIPQFRSKSKEQSGKTDNAKSEEENLLQMRIEEAKRRKALRNEKRNQNVLFIDRVESELKSMNKTTRKSNFAGFFPTPENVIEQLLDYISLKDGDRVLEPSAGAGAIADAIIAENPNVVLDVIEYNQSLRELLEAKGHTIVEHDFLQYSPNFQYDAIVMNPPFEGMADVFHVQYAYSLLKPQGRIAAVMSESVFFRADPVSEAFRTFVSLRGSAEKLPEGTFKESDTMVNTRIVFIEKPLVEFDDIQQQDLEMLTVKGGEIVESLITGKRYVVVVVAANVILQQLNTTKTVTIAGLRADEYEIISQEQLDSEAKHESETKQRRERTEQATDDRDRRFYDRMPDHGGNRRSSDISTERRQASSEWAKREPCLIRPEFTDRISEKEIEKFCSEHLEVNCKKAYNYQLEGVIKGSHALNKFGGFINADGAGVGKTIQILLLAYIQAKKLNKPSFIVTMSKDVINDSFKQASNILNIKFKKWSGLTINYDSSDIYICTYNDLISRSTQKNKIAQVAAYSTNADGSLRYIPVEDYWVNIEPEKLGTLIFDESHKLINEDTGWTKQGLWLLEHAHSVAYFSATPMDKPGHILYLRRAGLYRTRNQYYALMWSLGFEHRCRKFKDKYGYILEKCSWVLRSDVSREVMAIALENLFDDLTEDGIMIKREYDLSNMRMETIKLKLPAVVQNNLSAIRFAWYAEAQKRAVERARITGRAVNVNLGNFAGVIMQEQIREVEQYKIRDAMRLIDKELRDGRSVVLFANQVNEGEALVMGLDRKRIGTIAEIKSLLKEKNIEFVELTGNVSPERFEQNTTLFQENKVRVALVSPGKGGTGINLDDKTGNAPRTMIVMTYPQTARLFVQMCGRINRATTKSEPKILVLIGNVTIEETLQNLIVTKMHILASAVSGSVSALLEENENVEQNNMKEPEPVWNYFEGVTNLVDGRKRYAVWAKKLHPDTSGYDSASEFRAMNEEYEEWKKYMQTYKAQDKYEAYKHSDKKSMKGKNFGVPYDAVREIIGGDEIIKIKRHKDYTFSKDFMDEAGTKGFKRDRKYDVRYLYAPYSQDVWNWVTELFEQRRSVYEVDEEPSFSMRQMVTSKGFTDNKGQTIKKGQIGIVAEIRERPTSPTTSVYFYDVNWIIPKEQYTSLRNNHTVILNSKRVHKDDLILTPLQPDEVSRNEFPNEYIKNSLYTYNDGSGNYIEYYFSVYDFKNKEYKYLPALEELNRFSTQWGWVINSYMEDARWKHIDNPEIKKLRIKEYLIEQAYEEAVELWDKYESKKGMSDVVKIDPGTDVKITTEPQEENTSHNGFRDVDEVMAVQTQPVRLHRTAKFFGTMNFPCNFLLWGIHGGGKSTFSLIMLQDLLLQKDAKILYAMTEEKIKTGRLKERITRARVNIDGVIFNDALTLDSLRELLENNQDLKYVVIDSVNMLRSNSQSKQIVTEDEVLALMEDFDNRSFIFIAHSVKDDTTYRGFPRLANMVDTVIHVSNGVARTKKHRDDKANNEMSIYSPSAHKERQKLTIKGLVI